MTDAYLPKTIYFQNLSEHTLLESIVYKLESQIFGEPQQQSKSRLTGKPNHKSIMESIFQVEKKDGTLIQINK